VLAGLNPAAGQAFAVEPPRDVVRSAVAQALRQRGHAVVEHVGRSQFRCDLAIVGPDNESYALAILLDGQGGAPQPSRERYVFRPAILRAFGWRVLDLPVADWLRDPHGMLTLIEARLSGPAVDVQTEGLVDLPPPPEPEPEPATAPPSAVERASPAGMREFTFQQGTSNKFWRIGVSGAELTVAYGRVGTRGQTVIKTFDTPARAERELAKLIDEKLRKGYVEA
jgi:predicted DNA-binding WGR domain protein